MEYLPQFKLWLQNRNYTTSTVRNYLADLGKYLSYVHHLPQVVSLDITSKTTVHILSPQIISLYVSYLSGKTNSRRYLASLNLFCQFALDQHLISQNPLKAALHTPAQSGSNVSLDTLVNLWEKTLNHQQASPSTIKNYINDLNQYISWLNQTAVDT